MITVMIIVGIFLMSLLLIPLVIMMYQSYKDAERKRLQKESEKKRGY